MGTKSRRCEVCDTPIEGRRFCVKHYKENLRAKAKHPDTHIPEEETLNVHEAGSTASLVCVSPLIDTKEKAIKQSGMDMLRWAVDTVDYKTWMSLRREDKKPVQMHGFKIRFKQIVSQVEVDAVAILADRIAKHSPKVPKFKRKPSKKMLEFSPFDMHFGKLAWGEETGEDYDLKIAEGLFSKSLAYILDTTGEVDEFTFPIGSDFFHTDGVVSETTQGTPQDSDGRWSKVYAAGQLACVSAVDRMLQLGPVRIVWLPGNHDWVVSFHLNSYLAAWYRNNHNVTVDISHSPRKYVEYHTALIGFTHGNEEKHASLPTIMATEKPEAWARTSHHEWHLGHTHRRRATEHTSVDTHTGVTVRTLPSLSAADAWHHKKGYIGTRAAEAYLWDAKYGYAGHFSCPITAISD